jgi:hypothetical protein
LDNVSQKMREYAICYYGNLITTEEPVYYKEEKLWKAKLKANYPRLNKKRRTERAVCTSLTFTWFGNYLYR